MILSSAPQVTMELGAATAATVAPPILPPDLQAAPPLHVRVDLTRHNNKLLVSCTDKKRDTRAGRVVVWTHKWSC